MNLRGERCIFSCLPLSALLKRGFDVCVPTSRHALFPYIIEFIAVDRVPFRLGASGAGTSTFRPAGVGHLAIQTRDRKSHVKLGPKASGRNSAPKPAREPHGATIPTINQPNRSAKPIDNR
jgi:hypothetical protein